MTKLLLIETHGCQMNELDSELVVASLRRRGYGLTDDPARADAILLNTCSIREQVENKIYSALGRLKQLKRQHPEKVIGVLGCMAQNHQRAIFARAGYVDFVVGPGQLRQVPDLIERVEAGEGKQIEVGLGRRDGSLEAIKRSHESFDPLRDPQMRPNPFQAYVRVQIGCDKFCTYCVVPMVRGPEQYRPPEHIEAEARALADQGCLEITLLGQTVNSYRYREGDTNVRLSDVIARLHRIESLRRIKFVTNYPNHLGNDLLEAMRDLPKVSPYLHVPAQSGSDAVLRRMKRGYTAAAYREVIDRIRHFVPEAAISSDFIVGFSGETEEDFQQTVELVEFGRFKNAFIFKYNERPGTKGAARLADDVPLPVKRRRNTELLTVQDAIGQELNEQFVGRSVEVLVEGASKVAQQTSQQGERIQLTGRTPCDRIVVFDGPPQWAGRILPVLVHDAGPHTLFGGVIQPDDAPTLHTLELGP